MKLLITPVLALAFLFATPVAAGSCESPAFELLQQMTGEWRVTRNNEPRGTLTMRVAAGDCALIEEWVAVDGTRATALHWQEQTADENSNADTAILRQVYVDDSGWVMRADGKVEVDVLIYQGKTRLQDEDVVLRATIHGLGTDAIVHIGDISKDNGATWQRMSTLHYQRTS